MSEERMTAAQVKADRARLVQAVESRRAKRAKQLDAVEAQLKAITARLDRKAPPKAAPELPAPPAAITATIEGTGADRCLVLDIPQGCPATLLRIDAATCRQVTGPTVRTLTFERAPDGRVLRAVEVLE
jgi:hypothetical protein